jgi:hypothetical protein
MRRIARVACAIALLGIVTPVRADDEDAKVRKVIAKAIKAHGGADKLKKFKASTSKAKGKFYGLGDALEYTEEMYIQLPDRTRIDIDATNFKFIQVFDRDKGWQKIGDNTMEMNKDQVAERKQEMRAAVITHLASLTDKAYDLSAIGDAKVGDRMAYGVRVAQTGQRDVNLFFDRQNGLLIKSETRGKDTMNEGKEFTSETFYSNYKAIDGVMVAHKIEIKRDGKQFVEAEMTEVKLSEKLDDSTFAKP